MSKDNAVGKLKSKVATLEGGWKDLSARLARDHGAFKKEWADKFNGLGERFKKIVLATGQQLAQLQANSQVHSNVLEQLDINVQAVAKMHLENYGRFEQIMIFLERAGAVIDVSELTQEELVKAKEKAKEAYEATMTECFRQVHEERAAAVEAQRKAAEKAKVDSEKEKEEAVGAKKEAEDKEEAEFAQKTLEEAEARNISTSTGGQGASIPADAEVFGG